MALVDLIVYYFGFKRLFMAFLACWKALGMKSIHIMA